VGRLLIAPLSGGLGESRGLQKQVKLLNEAFGFSRDNRFIGREAISNWRSIRASSRPQLAQELGYASRYAEHAKTHHGLDQGRASPPRKSRDRRQYLGLTPESSPAEFRLQTRGSSCLSLKRDLV
jgi:hypothetical protein